MAIGDGAMDSFKIHSNVIADYRGYIESFINIRDQEILAVVQKALSEGRLWPEPLIQFNPSYKITGELAAVVASEKLHPLLTDIFKGYRLYQHQMEALRLGTAGSDFVVTSGTGSGKSLTYIGTIFDRLLKNPQPGKVSAVIVYPMNALINSQVDEIERYKEGFEKSTGKPFPITFGKYTGQEDEDERKRLQETPPDILLTNYMMLELILTRIRERGLRDTIYAGLRYLVFDELHMYRGRQGADVAMLIRRIKAQCANPVTCIGTSATMVKAVFVPQRGVIVQLGSFTRVLCTNGPELIKRPVSPLPAPLLVHIHPESTYRDLASLSEQVLKFTSLSWRSTLPAKLPVTIYYSELIAGLLSRMRGVPDWSPAMLNIKLRASKWFL